MRGIFDRLRRNRGGGTTSDDMARNNPDTSASLQDRPDHTQPYGTNPITNFTVEFLGYQTADNSCSHRDLGFTGQIQGKWYAVYGDTLWCSCGVSNPKDDECGFHGMVRNAISAVTDNALIVHDLNLNDDSPIPHQNQFVPFNPAWGENNQIGFGGTSLVETNSETAEAALFYLVNANDAGLKGAGVARVKVIDGTPTVTERLDLNNTGFWWPTDEHPRYGDIAAYRDVHSDYIYALGGVPNSVTSWPENQYVYQIRVKASQAFDLNAYEYWWGRNTGWSRTPLNRFDCTTAVLWGVGQGQIVWSNYFNCYIFVHLDWNRVALRTATSPEGPWSEDVIVYTPKLHGPFAYAGVAHPYADPTGQTLTVSYTNSPNIIEVIKVSFAK